jgi:CheY-like chemotaxis protein
VPARNILLLDRETGEWRELLSEFFEDTPSTLHVFSDSAKVSTFFKHPPDISFINPELFSPAFFQKMKVYRQSFPDIRMFGIGGAKPPPGFPFDGVFDAGLDLTDFQRCLVKHLPFADKLRVLVIDDEREVGDMVRDFFKDRAQPSFDILHTDSGKKGLVAIREMKPDVVLLDVKMPEMDGREVYRQIKARGFSVPVIIFFDSVSGDEMSDIRKIGNPAVLEKSSPHNTLLELLDLIKKMAYFG